MPTGYTDRIYRGVETSFRTFMLECARGFGALVHLRDEPGAPIPDVIPPSDYYAVALAKARRCGPATRGPMSSGV